MSIETRPGGQIDMHSFENQLKAPETEVRPEITSSAADKVRSVADRVAGWLDKRALKREVNSAHTEALADYKSQDRDAYRDHLNNLSTDESVGFRARGFAGPRADYENVRHGVIQTGEKITDSIDSAYENVRGVAIAAAEIGVGAGVLVAETVKNRVDQGREAYADAKDVATDYIGVLKERFNDARDKALTRKYERRGKWMKFKRSTSERVAGAKEQAKSKVEQGKTSVHNRRAAGRAAIDAYRATNTTLKEQNKL